LVLFALVGLGALATLLSVREERQSAHLVDERAAGAATSRIREALSTTVGSLRGGDALAVDGIVDRAEFEAFATGVTSQSLFQALAFAEVVPQADRAGFTTRTGLTIQDTDGKGGFVAGTPRARSLVVAMVSPLNDSNRAVLGFDVASDPVRLAAAEMSERTGLPAMSDRISTATLAKPGVAVVAAIRRPDGTTIGFLTSGLDISDLLLRSGVDIDSYDGFSIDMDGQLLIGAPTDGSTERFDLAGHRFSITVNAADGVNPTLPILVGSGTLALLIAVLAVARRTGRQREQIELSARRSSAINDLGQALAAATDAGTVIGEVLDRGAAIMDARHVAIALRSTEHPTRLTLSYNRDVPPEIGSRLENSHVGDRRPFSECTRTGVEVVVPDAATLTARFPQTTDDATTAGVQSLIWVPLVFGRDLCVGALGFTWAAPMSGTELEERRVAARTVAELVGRSLERAVTTMAVQTAADNLGELSRGLAGSHNQRDVQTAVRVHAANILGASHAELVLDLNDDTDHGPSAVERTIENRDGVAIARLVLGWRRSLVLGPAQSAVFDTMVDMIGQTLERTALTEQEHQVIVQLQRDLLPQPPHMPGLDVAVRYQPAMTVVGLGGDFYDLIVGPTGRVFVIIGDVTGHGSEAVAAMAELKAVIHNLLGSGSTLGTVCDEADLLLDRRGMYATAQIAEIDPHLHTIRLINAGHPYPVLLRGNGPVELLTSGHRPLLGLRSPVPTVDRAVTISFEAGDALLLYTDGLIERRTQSIDVGIQGLVALVDEHGRESSATELVDRVLAAAQESGNGDKTDDDVALLAVRLLD